MDCAEFQKFYFVFYWVVMRIFRAGWLVLGSLFAIKMAVFATDSHGKNGSLTAEGRFLPRTHTDPHG
jgi:hypothetical protein